MARDGELPLRWADGRRRLVRLYRRGVDLRADLVPVVEGTEGVMASFIKELLRRAVLSAVRADGSGGVPVVGDELVDVARAIADERASLTGIRLGEHGDRSGTRRTRPSATGPRVAWDGGESR